MRDSQSLLEQVLSFSHGELSADQVHAMLGTADDVRLHALASAMADRDTSGAMRILDESIDAGIDAGRLAEQLLCYFRDLMAVTVDCDPSLLRHTSASLHPELKQLGERWGLQTVLAVVGLIDQTLVRIRHSVYSRVLLESTLIQICNLPDLQHISDLAAAASNAGLPSNQKKKPTLNPQRTAPAGSESAPSRPATTSQQEAQAGGQPSTPTQTSGTSPDQGTGAVDQPTTTTVTDSPNQTRTTEARPTGPSVANPSSDQAPQSDHTGEADTSNNLPIATTAVSPAGPWTQAEAQRVWQEALGDLESMTEAFARMVNKAVAVGTQQLRLQFPANGNLAMKRCELPEHRNAIVQAVSQRAGRDITLDYYLAEAVAAPKKAETTVNKPSRVQRMREIEANELVRNCIELFSAEIVRIDRAN